MRNVLRRPRLLYQVALAGGLMPALLLVFFLGFPGQPRLWYHLWQAERHFASREYGAALRQYIAAGQAAPNDPRPHALAGALHLYQGRYDRSEEGFRSALDRDPTNAEALAGLGMTAAARGRDDEAISFFRAALSKATSGGRVRAELGAALARLGADGAETELEQALASSDLAPKQRQMSRYLLALLVVGSRPEEAGRLIELADRNGGGAVSAAQLSGARELAALITGDRREPRDVVAVAAASGYELLRAGLLIPARRELERTVSLCESCGDAIAYLGEVHRRQGDVEGALKLLARATSLPAPSPIRHYLRAIALRSANRVSDACREFGEATVLDPENPQLYQELARTLVVAADYYAASGAFEQAAAHAKGDLSVLLDAASFHLDHLYRVDRALILGRAAVHLAPDDVVARDVLGWAHYLNSDLDGAIDSLRHAIDIDEAYPSAHFHLAVVYGAAGNETSAIAHYRRVVDLDAGAFATRAAEALSELPPVLRQ